MLSYSVYCQPQINNWFFASGNGLSFSSGNPVYVPGGQIGVQEGASAVSDKSGQLLFYTDGMRVWNRQHILMPNGINLAGWSGSSTQSSLIVPKTKDGLQYYVFTTADEGGTGGLEYSIVDMSLNAGYGDVTTKNVPLVDPSSEKIAAVMHCNKKGYWVITHQYGSDAFYSYYASDTGVNLAPVISHIGSVIPVSYGTMAGCLKASPDGKKLAAANGNLSLELFDFDNKTGIVSNEVNMSPDFPPGLPYGVEFSLSSLKLYVSYIGYWDWNDYKWYAGVFQFDLSLPSTTDIVNSKVLLSRYEQGNELGTLTRGPDGKIYMAQYRKNFLSVINDPEIAGTGCNFIDTAFLLQNEGQYSLPNFVNNYNFEQDSFAVNPGFCINKPVSFNYTNHGDANSVLWSFDDPASGTLNTSSIYDPSHSYSKEGTYTVKLIKYGSCGNDTLAKQIVVGDVKIDLGNDTTICEKSSIKLDPGTKGSNTYQWSTGATTATYTAIAAGQYWVQVTNNANGCLRRDTINITTKPLPIVNLGKDTALCPSQTLLLDAQNSGGQFLWQDNSNQQMLSAGHAGTYWAEVTINGCKARDTITVSSITKPSFSLGPDQFICPDQPILLDPGVSNVSYKWQDGSIKSTYLANSEGVYFVDVTNSCGTARDSITILKSSCKVYIPSAFTPNNDGLNDYFKVSGTSEITEFDMNIYNRWGEIVFSTKNKDVGWDGKYKGVELSSAVYIYVIKYKEINSDTKQTRKGTVTLIR